MSHGNEPGQLGRSRILEGLCTVKRNDFFFVGCKQLGAIKLSKEGSDWADLSFR